MIIAQITDLHIMPPGPNHLGLDTGEMLTNAVDRLNTLDPQPDIVLITGDLTDLGKPAEYEELRRRLAHLRLPYFVLPGNHDVRGPLRAAFADHAYLPANGEFLHYTLDLGPVRVIALDTVIPGSHAGLLCADRLAWVEAALDDAAGKAIVIAMHHPPMLTGIPFMDAIGLDGRDDFAALVGRHDRVERITCGHVHRLIQCRFAGTIASTCSSTAHQVAFTLRASAPAGWSPEPPALQLHIWREATGLVTHTLPIEAAEPRDFD